MKIEEIKRKIEKSIIALATCDKNGDPHNIAVQVNKIEDNKIIITDNYIQKTKENIKNNSKVALVFYEDDEGFSIKGKAKYINSGKLFEVIKSFPENKGFPAKGAIIIEIEEIKEL